MPMPEAHHLQNPDVRAVFDSYPEPVRSRLLDLRALIFRTAGETNSVGDLVETLKWGQPSYLTARPKTGSTIRIDAVDRPDADYALFVHCQTSLMATYRELYPDLFTFDGKRALVFSADRPVPEDALKHCIALALTYHLRPRSG